MTLRGLDANLLVYLQALLEEENVARAARRAGLSQSGMSRALTRLQILAQLDCVIEGAGTMLDHAVVCWVTELATPTHQHHDVGTVLAGGCNGFLKTGRYVRYPRNLPNPIGGYPSTGPAHNRLHVSLLHAMGQTDDSFGMTGAIATNGTPLSFRGPLTELQG
jgi:Bacterial regulatory helix-turn-helix protein, lysR family